MSVHNGERYLAKAIQSILDQTYTDFEFIIVNDGSTDNSLQILEDYRSKDSRIRLIHQENAGIARALNNAFALSRGKYIARMDGDDISLPDRLEKQLQFLEENRHVHLLGCQYIEIDEHDVDTAYENTKPLSHESIVQQIPFTSPIAHPSYFMVREVMSSLSGYRNFWITEDYDFLLRAIDHNFILANSPEKLILYRYNRSGLSLSNKKQQHINNRMVYKLHLQRIRGIKEDQRYIERLSIPNKGKHPIYTFLFNTVRIKHRQFTNTRNVLVKLLSGFIIFLCLLLSVRLSYFVFRYFYGRKISGTGIRI